MSEPDATSTELGRMQPLAPREVWPREARDPTRWLLLNAYVLSDVLGMQFELTEAEHSVGGFSLDRIDRDVAIAIGEAVIGGTSRADRPRSSVPALVVRAVVP